MLDHEMAAQLQQYMGMLRRPLTITASLGEDAKSAELRVLLEQIAGMSPLITLQLDGQHARILRRLSHKAKHRLKAVVGMMQEDITITDRVKNGLRLQKP